MGFRWGNNTKLNLIRDAHAKQAVTSSYTDTCHRLLLLQGTSFGAKSDKCLIVICGC